MTKTKRVDVVICGNNECRRDLEVSKYRSGPPSENFPADQIHEVDYPDASGIRVQCSKCGHYTLYLRTSEMSRKT